MGEEGRGAVHASVEESSRTTASEAAQIPREASTGLEMVRGPERTGERERKRDRKRKERERET